MNKFSSRLNSAPPRLCPSVSLSHLKPHFLLQPWARDSEKLVSFCSTSSFNPHPLFLFLSYCSLSRPSITWIPASLQAPRGSQSDDTFPLSTSWFIVSRGIFLLLFLFVLVTLIRRNKRKQMTSVEEGWRRWGGKRGSMNKYRIENPQRNTENAGRTQRTSEED